MQSVCDGDAFTLRIANIQTFVQIIVRLLLHRAVYTLHLDRLLFLWRRITLFVKEAIEKDLFKKVFSFEDYKTIR